jgi:3-oxoacyl-[acyl-carrier-protein] synthase II
MKRSVVITGVGVISPLGLSLAEFGRRLFGSESGVRPVTRFDSSRFRCQRAAEIDEEAFQRAFPPANHEISRMGRFVRLALAAAQQALVDSALRGGEALPAGGGLFAGVAMGGLPEIEAGVLRQEERGPRRTLPYLIPSLIPNMAASQIALQNQITGPQYTVAGACASGMQALGLAMNAIAQGELAWALAGGSEAVVTPITFSGFEAMRALSTVPAPRPTPRPFDRESDGMIVGEGAAFFVLEDAAHASARGRAAYAELRGFSMSSEGERLILQSATATVGCIHGALAQAGLTPTDVDLVLAQATGLRAGDEQEALGLLQVFASTPQPPAITSIKGHIGHTFGASGPLGVAAVLESLRRQRVPATLHFQSALEGFEALDISGQPRDRKVRHCLIGSFGFGGITAWLALSQAEPAGS